MDLTRLKNPRNPYDIDLKAIREALFFVLDKMQALEARIGNKESHAKSDGTSAKVSGKKKRT